MKFEDGWMKLGREEVEKARELGSDLSALNPYSAYQG
jgi:hypothetical protein